MIAFRDLPDVLTFWITRAAVKRTETAFLQSHLAAAELARRDLLGFRGAVFARFGIGLLANLAGVLAFRIGFACEKLPEPAEFDHHPR